MPNGPRPTLLWLAAGALLLAGARSVVAAPYPARSCVARKLEAAAGACRGTFLARARFERSLRFAAFDASRTRVAHGLASRWGLAEASAAKKGTDCAEASGYAAETFAGLDSAAGAFFGQVGGRNSEACIGAAPRAAGTACRKALEAEGRNVAFPKRDPQRRRLATTRDHVRARLLDALPAGCYPGFEAGLADAAEAIIDQIAVRLQTAPHVPSTWAMYSPPSDVEYNGQTLHPICARGTPYSFWARRGTVNKLVVYYQGGGACFSNLTCSPVVHAFKDTAGPGDNPSQYTEGIANVNNPNNPFRDWNAVFVSYCTGDIHWGDATVTYLAPPAPPLTIHHRGAENARVVEKWAREHFVNPDEVFVTGSSAGAYGAWFNAPLHEGVWPASKFEVLADAGNGVITQSFLDSYFPNWNFAANVPTDIPGLTDVLINGSGIPGYTEIVANFFPRTRWAHYCTAYDGGFGGQTGFYNIMLNNNNPVAALTWWNASCQFNSVMRAQDIATAAAVPSNYRYYIGTGSRHTMWGSNKVYTDTTGGVPTLVDWVSAMIDGTSAWTDVQCTNCGLLLSGDPRPPTIPTPPFQQVGSDVVVVCS